MTIVDLAVYEDGLRRSGELALEDACEAGREQNAFVWIGLQSPTEAEFDAVRREFNLHDLAVEDAIKAHQRPKLERYGDSLLMVLKTAIYHEQRDEVEFGEILLFIGDGFLISVRHGQAAELHQVRQELEADPDRLSHGPGAVLHAIVDRVVDGYFPVAAAVEEDIEEVEAAIFSPERHNPAERIYKLKREVLEFYRATQPLVDPLDRLAKGDFGHAHGALGPYFRDVFDHLVRVVEAVDGSRDLLNSALTASLTQVGVRQNEDMRKISAWVAIIAVPTMIAGIYGMNFEHMPELGWRFGYPVVLAVMAIACFALWRYFRRVGWL